MQVTLNKWGGSIGFRMPASILQELGIGCGNQVDIRVENGKAIVEPITGKRQNLIKLLENITIENLHNETDVGGIVGKEEI